MKRPSSTMLALLALSGSALFWAGNFIVGRALREAVPPLWLTLGRWVVAALILLPLAGRATWRARAAVWRARRLVVFLSVSGVVLFQLCVYGALQRTTAVNAIIFLSLTPVAIALIGRFWFGERLNSRQWLGIGVSLLGAMVIIGRSSSIFLTALRFNRGDVLMLAAVCLWAAYSHALRHRPATLPHAVLLMASVVVGVGLMMPLAGWAWWRGLTVQMTPPVAAGIVYVGVCASVLAFYFWNWGVSVLGASRAGVFLHLMPLFGAILSFVFLDEGIHGFHLVGASGILGGIWLMNRAEA